MAHKLQRSLTTRERIMQRAMVRRNNHLQFQGFLDQLHVESMVELARISGLKPGRVVGLRRGSVTMKPEEIVTFERLIAERAIPVGDVVV